MIDFRLVVEFCRPFWEVGVPLGATLETEFAVDETTAVEKAVFTVVDVVIKVRDAVVV